MEAKPIYLSKTFWVQMIGLVVVIFGSQVPGVASFLQEHFVAAGSGWAVVNVILRLVSKDKVEIV